MLRKKFNCDTRKRKRNQGEVTVRTVKKRRTKELKIPVVPPPPPEPRLHRHFRPPKPRVPPKYAFADTGSCDVQKYFSDRVGQMEEALKENPGDAGLQEQRQTVFMNWMSFQARIQEVMGGGSVEKDRAGAGAGKSRITDFFSAQPTFEDKQKRLVRMCRTEVFGDQSGYEYPPSPPSTLYCCNCGSNQEQRRFDLVCPVCGVSVPSVSVKDRNMKEFEGVQTTFHNSYKRRNHLNEWLLRVQACDRPIPEVVVQAVADMFRKWSLPLETANYQTVRKFLRATGYQKYFDNIPQIIVRITKRQIPPLPKKTLVDIRRIFLRIQGPFEEHKPKDRKNFISYSFVLFKVFELLDLDEYLAYFPMLKSRQNLMRADELWKKVCDACDFEFISTS